MATHREGYPADGQSARKRGLGLQQAREGMGERHSERECSDDLRAETDGRVGSAEGRDLTLLIGMAQRSRWGPCRRHGATKAGQKLLQRKWDLRGLEKGGGGGLGLGRKAPPPPSARPQRAPPRPGALRAAAWAVGERSQGSTIRTREGGLGGGKGRSQGSEPCWGRGGATPWEKGLGTSRMDQSTSKARVASRGSFGQWEGRTLRRFGGRKEKKSPSEQQSNPFGGLEGWKWASFINVLAPAFPFEGWGRLHHSWLRGVRRAEEGPGKVQGDWPFTGGT